MVRLSTNGIVCENCLCPGYGVSGLSGTTCGISSLGNFGKGFVLTCAVMLVLFSFPAVERGKEPVWVLCVGSLHLDKWRVKLSV